MHGTTASGKMMSSVDRAQKYTVQIAVTMAPSKMTCEMERA